MSSVEAKNIDTTVTLESSDSGTKRDDLVHDPDIQFLLPKDFGKFGGEVIHAGHVSQIIFLNRTVEEVVKPRQIAMEKEKAKQQRLYVLEAHKVIQSLKKAA